MTKKTLAALAAAVVAAAAIYAFRSTRPAAAPIPSMPSSTSDHGADIDNSMAAFRAMFHAPAGATACETAYNAFKASDDVAKAENVKAVVVWLAPRDEFLTKCSALSPEAQRCLAPAYKMKNQESCK